MANPRDSKNNSGPDLDDISSRLKDLGSRIDAEKSEQRAAQKPSTKYQGASDYSKGYKLASEFVAGVLVGGLIGFGLDKLFGTLPLFLIVFLLLGFGAGLLNMSRSANRTPPNAEVLRNMPAPDDDEDEDK
jgi:ATP synthase protein I